jgi:hypothetical protein
MHNRLLCAALAIGGLACDPGTDLSSLAPPEVPGGPDIETVQNAVTTANPVPMTAPALVKTYVDCAGVVVSKMWSCDATEARDLETGTCPVGDANYVVVGGGAYALGGETYPGAFLVDQRIPSINRDSFQASSKAHVKVQPHKLRVYVIGLQILGVSRAQLLANIGETSTKSLPSSTPGTSITVPAGRLLLGGYVTSSWIEGTSPGQLLVGSWGSLSTNLWQGQTMDHLQTDPLTVTVHLVHIAPSIAGIPLESVEAGTVTYATSGVGQATVTLPRSALTGIAGWSDFEKGQGRALFRMGPLNTTKKDYQVTVTSKDHVTSDSGRTWVNAIGLQRKPSGPIVRCPAQVE